MAYQIANFINPDTLAKADLAYARITSITVNDELKAAKVQLEIFDTQTARAAKKRPIYQRAVVFSDAQGAPALYSASFGAAPVPTAQLPKPPATAADVLKSQAYVALKRHPQVVAILGSATPV